jgi:hypothetical protein
LSYEEEDTLSYEEEDTLSYEEEDTLSYEEDTQDFCVQRTFGGRCVLTIPCSRMLLPPPSSPGCLHAHVPPIYIMRRRVSYEEEDTCMSYEEEDTCMSPGRLHAHVSPTYIIFINIL